MLIFSVKAIGLIQHSSVHCANAPPEYESKAGVSVVRSSVEIGMRRDELPKADAAVEILQTVPLDVQIGFDVDDVRDVVLKTVACPKLVAETVDELVRGK